MEIDLLLTHGNIITMDSNRNVMTDSTIAVNEGRIIDVGQSDRLRDLYQARKTIECQHKALLPGLIDCHGHAGHSMIKGLAVDTASFGGKVAKRIYFHYSTDDFWYVDGLLSALDRLRCGVTCGMSVMGCEPRSDHPVFGSNHAKAYAEVGIREIVGVGPRGNPWPREFGRWVNGKMVERMVTFEEAMEGTEGVIQAWDHGANDRIRVFVTPFTIIPSLPTSGRTNPDIAIQLTPHDKEMTRCVRELAHKYNTRIHSDGFGGLIRLAARDENALLGPDVHLQHCHGLALDEIEIIAKTDTRIGHSPESTHYRCPFPELIYAGATVAITTDGPSSHNTLDLLIAMRKAKFLERVNYDDRFYFPPGKLLECITIDAARALGMENEIGSLEKGKKADIIVFNLRQPNFTPNYMLVHRIVNEAVGRDVETVIVDGKIVMENRKVLTVNELDILDQATEESLRTIERAGLTSFLNAPLWGKVYQTFEDPIDDQLFNQDD
jgi:5-methylthioadenosine/S-adenosylhomocysteine deaminase